MRKTIEIHDAVADPPKKTGEYLAFVGWEDCTGGYWTCLKYGKDVDLWNVAVDPVTGLTSNDENAFDTDTVTHWIDLFDPHEEAEA